MSILNFIQENTGQLLGYLFGAGGIFAFIVERKKNRAETKGVEADAESKEINNSSKVVDLYKQALDDLENRYEKKYDEIITLYERKVKVLKDEIKQLESSFARKIKLLEDEIKLKNRFITSLKKEATELRKQLKDAANSTK